MTILDAIADRKLFGPWLDGTSWDNWLVLLAAVFGLGLTDEQLEIYQRCTGRTTVPAEQVREAYLITGRRGGKSRIAALVAVYIACFRKYDDVLAPGEVGTVAILAADRRQARTIFRYVEGFVDHIPMLSGMVASRTKDSISFNNRTVIEVQTASFRHVRGFTLLAVLCDELAFWRTDDSANPDAEILAAVRPGMATVPNPLLLCLSSPHSRTGELYRAFRKHHGRDDSNVLVWQAATRVMNPSVPQSEIDRAYEDDPQRAAAEFGAEFRSDVEAFLTLEALDAVTVPGRLELPPVPGVRYRAFTDPSGGASDSFTLAISHFDRRERVPVLDCIRERRPPFSPKAVVKEFAETLRAYHCSQVTGDRYAGEWPREAFREHGITYRTSDKTKSEIYAATLPKINSGGLELLDHKRLVAQAVNLERRVSRAGRESIDHNPGGRDDVCNAAFGSLVAARPQQSARLWVTYA